MYIILTEFLSIELCILKKRFVFETTRQKVDYNGRYVTPVGDTKG